MFCVTTATILGLAPHPMNTSDPEERKANRAYLEGWMDQYICQFWLGYPGIDWH
jgi:CO2 hydration protein (ChpXY).